MALGLRRSLRGVWVAVACLAVLFAVVAWRDLVHLEPSSEATAVVAPPPPAPVEAPAMAPAPPKRVSRVKSARSPKSAPVVAAQPALVVPPPAVADPAKVAAPAPAPALAPVAVVAAPVADEEPLPPPPPAPPAEEPEVVEAAPGERDGNGAAIARLIADQKRAAVRACFESELKAQPKLRGTVVVELDLAPPNKVAGVRVNDDLNRPEFTRCVKSTMESVKFAALDEEVSVSVPYNLVPGRK